MGTKPENLETMKAGRERYGSYPIQRPNGEG